MAEFWLVRHGQTNWNVEGRYQGSRDIALNENGHNQANRIADRLKDVAFEAVYSSPLMRTLHTAEAIAEKNRMGLKVQTDPRLVEVDLGEWEGKLFSDIQRDYPEEIRERKDNPLHARPPGGETALEVAERMAQAADEIAARHPHGPVLLVSHGLALASLICQARNIPLEQVYDRVPENAEPVVVHWNPGPDFQVQGCRCEDPYFMLELLYGKEAGRQAASTLRKMLETFHPPPPAPPLDEHDALLITYADQFQRPGELPLHTFIDFADRYLRGVVSGLHLLPFFPYSSDDGFSVIDYSKVKPEWGDWADITRLGNDFHLMFDAVINHISAESDWFQRFLRGEEAYQDFFISLPPDTDLSTVVRPRTSPLLTRFETAQGPQWVWTTFSADQVDLNYKNPQVLLSVVENLLIYVEKCAKLLRLDAIAYVWKEVGTPCIHMPQAHLLVSFLNALFKRAAPHVLLVTETNVPHRENVSYFGNGHNEAHMVYNFALPPLVLHAFQTGSARVLSEWASRLTLPSMQVTFFNFLASHDGIGLNPARGILTEAEIEAVVARAVAHGGRVSSKTNADGSESPYEINISYFDALSDPDSDEPLEKQVKRFLAAQAVMLALVGVPGIYVHSLFGTRNWQAGVRATGQNRTINRYRFNADQLAASLLAQGSLQQLTYQGYRRLLEARSASPAFHPHGAQLVLPLREEVFSLLRVSPDGMHSAFCLHNLSDVSLEVDLSEAKGLGSGTWQDLLSAETFELPNTSIRLDAYGVRWLSPQGEN